MNFSSNCSTTLAVGAAYLARKKAIVQKLSAIESLAGKLIFSNMQPQLSCDSHDLGVDILCSDKTGTLTANQLSLHEPFVLPGVDVNWYVAIHI
jgi:H+-transporting ATPase